MEGKSNLCGYDVPLRAQKLNEPRFWHRCIHTPNPRKLKNFRKIIEDGICKVVVTINVPMQVSQKMLYNSTVRCS